MKQEKKNINVIKRLSREASLGNNSFGDYHRESPVSVPFVWESQPGTPKHKSHHHRPLPPLTPPPSYSYGGGASRRSKPSKHLIQSLFPRISTSSSKKGGRDTSSPSSVSFSFPSSPSSSQWSSSSSSTPSSPENMGSRKYFHGRRRSAQKMSFDSRLEEGEEEEFSEFPISRLFYNTVETGVGAEETNRALGCCSTMMRIFKG